MISKANFGETTSFVFVFTSTLFEQRKFMKPNEFCFQSKNFDEEVFITKNSRSRGLEYTLFEAVLMTFLSEQLVHGSGLPIVIVNQISSNFWSCKVAAVNTLPFGWLHFQSGFRRSL